MHFILTYHCLHHCRFQCGFISWFCVLTNIKTNAQNDPNLQWMILETHAQEPVEMFGFCLQIENSYLHWRVVKCLMIRNNEAVLTWLGCAEAKQIRRQQNSHQQARACRAQRPHRVSATSAAHWLQRLEMQQNYQAAKKTAHHNELRKWNYWTV